MVYRKIFDIPNWQPGTLWEDLIQVRNKMDRMFEDLRQGFGGEDRSGVFPSVNLTEDTDNYYLRAELPGIRSEDLDVQATSANITISGERRIATQPEAKYHRRERESGRFSRAIALPGDSQSDKITASLKDGVLTLVIPKAEAVKPRQVKID